MDDRDERRRRRPDDDDDEDYPRRRPPPPRGASKGMSVVGLISLIIGVLALILSVVPCLNLITWPLQIVGLVLAVVGVLLSAVGQRDGLGLPLSGLIVNVLACVVPVAMYLGFCGFGMQGAKQAAQQAQAAAQAEQERQEREEAEQRETDLANAATVVGLGAGPDGPVICLAALSALEGGGPDEPTEFSLDHVVQQYEQNEKKADDKYKGKILTFRGTVDRVTTDRQRMIVMLSGRIRGVVCEFDHVAERDRARLQKKQLVFVEGTCDGLNDLHVVHFSSCKVVE